METKQSVETLFSNFRTSQLVYFCENGFPEEIEFQIALLPDTRSNILISIDELIKEKIKLKKHPHQKIKLHPVTVEKFLLEYLSLISWVHSFDVDELIFSVKLVEVENSILEIVDQIDFYQSESNLNSYSLDEFISIIEWYTKAIERDDIDSLQKCLSISKQQFEIMNKYTSYFHAIIEKINSSLDKDLNIAHEMSLFQVGGWSKEKFRKICAKELFICMDTDGFYSSYIVFLNNESIGSKIGIFHLQSIYRLLGVFSRLGYSQMDSYFPKYISGFFKKNQDIIHNFLISFEYIFYLLNSEKDSILELPKDINWITKDRLDTFFKDMCSVLG